MLLEVDGLCASYGQVRALDGVSFALEEGRSAGIAGESACGKSTLGLAVMRALRGASVSGSISLNGEPLLSMDPGRFDREYRWKKISMIFQGAGGSLDPVFSVGDQLLQVLDEHGYEGRRRDAVSEALARVGLDGDAASLHPHEMSGGMRQRAAVAMAVMLDPDLVVADEPTTALDVLTQAQTVSLVRSLQESGTSFLTITHDLAVLAEVSDDVGIMYAGQMAEFGPASRVYSSPAHPYTRALLRSIPYMDGPRPGHIPGMPPDLRAPPGGCRFAPRCPEAFGMCSEDPPAFDAGGSSARCWLHSRVAAHDGEAGVDDAQDL